MTAFSIHRLERLSNFLIATVCFKSGKKPTGKSSSLLTSPEQSEQLATSDVPETTIEQSIFAYEEFLAEQQQRENDWEAARAAKRAKTTDTCSTPTTPAPVAVAPVAVAPVAEEQSIQDNEVGRLTKQLGEKNKECERLKREVQELKESSRKEAEKQLTVTENFYKVSNRFYSKRIVHVCGWYIPKIMHAQELLFASARRTAKICILLKRRADE